MPLAERYGEIANRSAGVGAIYMGMHLMLAAAFFLFGFLFGLIALVRIRGGSYGGRGTAWAGIILACLPLALAVIVFLVSSADSNPLR